MKRTIKFIGLILLGLSFSIVQQNKKEKEIEKHNIWVYSGVTDHQISKNNEILMVENGN